MITRREMFSRGMAAYFGGSFGCMKVLSGCGEVHDEKGAQKLPIVMLELGAKHHEDGIVTNLAARRLVCVDLGVADEIGNLNQAYDWGRGEDFLGFGDDVGGYWRLERVFEYVEPTEELHEGRFPFWCELSILQFEEILSFAIERFSGVVRRC